MACGQCGGTHPVMWPMEPGHDGTPWELCLPCYHEGVIPMKLGSFKKTAQMIVTEPEPNAAKEDVGDFKRPAAKRKKTG